MDLLVEQDRSYESQGCVESAKRLKVIKGGVIPDETETTQNLN